MRGCVKTPKTALCVINSRLGSYAFPAEASSDGSSSFTILTENLISRPIRGASAHGQSGASPLAELTV